MAEKFIVAEIVRPREKLPSWVIEQLVAVPNLEVRYQPCTTEEELLSVAADADMIWTMAAAPVLTPEVLPKLKRCKAIFRSGSGMDGYPVEAASKLGIYMCNCPESICECVAEHAVTLLFSFIRQIPKLDYFVRHRAQEKLPGPHASMNWHISGRTVGLVGFGRIGRRVTEMLAGFRMRILCYDPYATPEQIRAAGAEPVDLDTLLTQADYVTLHCPLTDETRHLIGERELKMMKPNAILVNTSRGPVIDEAALIQALHNHIIGGAALDVTDPEPPTADSPLFEAPNLILTPHIAAFSADFEKNYYECSIQVILECMRGEPQLHAMNKNLIANN